MQTMKVFMTGDIDNSMWLKSRADYGLSNDCFTSYEVAGELQWDEEGECPMLDIQGNEIPDITEIDQMFLDLGCEIGEVIIVEHMW